MVTLGVGAVSMRVYFSSYHLWGAEHFASLARSIEAAHSGPPKFSVRHRAYVTNCILSSVAFLEALINEFFDDAADDHLSYLAGLPTEQREGAAALWKLHSVERGSILDKFQVALVAVGGAPFDPGIAPFQDAVALIRLRNQLMHPRATTQNTESDYQQKLWRQWEARCPPNRLMHNSANPYFPDHLLGAGCAEWAVRSARGLAHAFIKRAGTSANYEKAELREDPAARSRMTKPPSKTEWDTSRLSAERRSYLDAGLSFEEIADRATDSATVISHRIEPYNTAPPAEKDGRQIIFVVRLAPKVCDLLYNAPDGMRGRYWQSPDYGFTATKQLIGGLLPKLMSFANQPPWPPANSAPMSFHDIKASLEGLSAKVWPREFDEDRKWMFVEDHLNVLRWAPDHGAKGPMWRHSPTSDDLEIKGAIIGVDQTEYIPDGKRDRSSQIHKYGFT